MLLHTQDNEKNLRSLKIADGEGTKEFWNNTFCITRDVLSPRPETEIILEFVLHIIDTILRDSDTELKPPRPSLSYHSYPTISLSHTPKFPIQILDCGTGSGCIGISLAETLLQYFPHSDRQDKFNDYFEIILSDISEAALTVARKNCVRILPKLENIYIVKAQLLELCSKLTIALNPTIIVANLPYVAPTQLSCVDINNEPILALEGKIQPDEILCFDSCAHYALDGMDIIHTLFAQCKKITHPHVLILEADPLQFDTLSRLASLCNYSHTGCIRDYSNYNRLFYSVKFT